MRSIVVVTKWRFSMLFLTLTNVMLKFVRKTSFSLPLPLSNGHTQHAWPLPFQQRVLPEAETSQLHTII